jgi:D-alanyl-D-alanine carboxypeptidase (penicillin-binding protein 5/6)
MTRKVGQRQWIFLVTVILLFTLVLPNVPFAKQQITKSHPQREPAYTSAVLMDYETGQMLFEKNPHEKVIPASLVKMMVLLLVMEKIESGAIHLSDPVSVSAWASKIGGQQVYLKEGETFTLEEFLKAIAISSANDAATAVAEFLAGNTEACVKMMNARAKELGMNDTTFANVHGLPPDKGQSENYTSAYDMALLGHELLKYPQILSWTSILEDSFRNGTFTLTNTNRDLLRHYAGADGLKTGFHPRGADFAICATAKRQDRRLIAVVMNVPQKSDRYRAVVNLLDLGFNQFERVVVLRKGFPVGDPIPIPNGKNRTTTLIAAENAAVLVEKGQENQIKKNINIAVQEITAPVKRGAKFGEVAILVGERPVMNVDLVVEEDIKAGSFVDRLKWWIVDKIS